MYVESDPKALRVLEFSLGSSNRVLRLRAVCMLSRVSCERREQWLATACGDSDPAVRETAMSVMAWTLQTDSPPWPQREDPTFDRIPQLVEPEESLDTAVGLRWEWEYAVEVWREDGLLVGVFLCTTCQEDDEHAKRIALGQAVLASTTPTGDRFEPSTAAAFIVGKRRIRREQRPSRRRSHGR